VRRGFSLAESLVTVLVFGLILAVVAEVYVQGMKNLQTTLELNEAMRSVFLAFELIRKDNARRAFANQDYPDGSIFNASIIMDSVDTVTIAQRDYNVASKEGHRIISDPGTDRWKPRWQLIQYEWVPVDGTDEIVQFGRRDTAGLHVLGGCYFVLNSSSVMGNTGFPGNPDHGYYSITLTGAGSIHPKVTYTTTLFMPIAPTFEPTPYLARDATP
jgi:prepilin-type N-terminal cleavage/methylation domain-containing protein